MKLDNLLGQVKASFIDYPSKISTVIFLGGCNFRCGYCHNPDIVNHKGCNIKQEDFFEFLKKRKKYLDGVCISGGEPTLTKDLAPFVHDIKQLGYLVKLDTNGTNPEILRKLIQNQEVDYIAMDLKAPLRLYNDITQVKVNLEDIKESIRIILNSDVEYEFRTTIAKEILSIEEIKEIIKLIPNAKRYCIQNFKQVENILDNDQLFTPYNAEELDNIKKELQGQVKELIIR